MRRRLSWFEELAGTIVQLWFQPSVIWSPRPGEAVVSWVENCALVLLPAVNRLVVAMGGCSLPVDSAEDTRRRDTMRRER